MSTNRIIILVLAVGALVGLFVLFKPTEKTNVTSQLPVSTSSAQPTTNAKTFELQVQNRKLVSGQDTIQVTEGDQVTIKITVDEDEELHLHGYDKSVDIQKDQPAELTFTANLTGSFPFELEHSKTDLGVLQVQPK